MVSRRDAVFSRRQVEGLIADGKSVIIVDGKVLRVDAWLPYHPGGDKAIRHMIGRDATDEVNALHSKEARSRMQNYQIGRIDGISPWDNFLPPIQGGKFRKYKGDREMFPSMTKLATHQNLQTTPDSLDPECISSCGSSGPPSSASSSDAGDFRRRKRASSVASSSLSSISSRSELDGLILDPETSNVNTIVSTNMLRYPELDQDTQESIVKKYRALDARLHSEGFYDCNYFAYVYECARYALLFAGFLFCLQRGWIFASAFCLGALWHQLSFTVHDAGHMGITHHFQVDSTIGMLIAAYIGGLSVGWWKHSHNIHHIITNDPEHDPDIQHIPFFAVSPRFFGSMWSTYYDRVMKYDATAKFLVRFQNFLYYPVLGFGRFNLYVNSWVFLLCGIGPRKGPSWWHRWFEMVGVAFFLYWYCYATVYKSIDSGWDRFLFVMVSNIVTMPLHVQITLSHFAMDTSSPSALEKPMSDMHSNPLLTESFAQKMLRTTMDVSCPQFLDFFHGGLQFQAVHHLYPRIPRHNLRHAQAYVRQFCKEVGVPYAIYGFSRGNQEVLGRLGEVARMAQILGECDKKMRAERIKSVYTH